MLSKDIIAFDMSWYSIIRIYGPQAEQFLQSQLTSDLGLLTLHNNQLGAFCNIQGRIQALCRIWKSTESFFIRIPKDVVLANLSELKKYAVFSRVYIEDYSKQWVKIGISGKKAYLYLKQIQKKIIVDSQEHLKSPDHNLYLVSNKLREDSYFELYGPSSLSQRVLKGVTLEPPSEMVRNLWSYLEIKAGIPEIFQETYTKLLPHDISLAKLGGVSFTKGCYRGQEIIARMEYRGNTKRQLYFVKGLRNNEPPRPGEQLFNSCSQENKHVVGSIIRSAKIDRKNYIALAEIKNSEPDKPTYLGSKEVNIKAVFNLPDK